MPQWNDSSTSSASEVGALGSFLKQFNAAPPAAHGRGRQTLLPAIDRAQSGLAHQASRVDSDAASGERREAQQHAIEVDVVAGYGNEIH